MSFFVKKSPQSGRWRTKEHISRICLSHMAVLLFDFAELQVFVVCIALRTCVDVRFRSGVDVCDHS